MSRLSKTRTNTKSSVQSSDDERSLTTGAANSVMLSTESSMETSVYDEDDADGDGNSDTFDDTATVTTYSKAYSLKKKRLTFKQQRTSTMSSETSKLPATKEEHDEQKEK